MSENHSESEIDLSGLLCPLPVLKARKRLETLQPGHVLKVIATDPMSAIDMPHFCNEQGHAARPEARWPYLHILDQTQMTFDFGAFNNWGQLKRSPCAMSKPPSPATTRLTPNGRT
ncbi:MAG: sulfurtransferase TusA family protein [Sphingomonadales bacterium]|nr:sulfurtransferase TusA family protein [Sphingomonadales bacterium]